VCQLWVEQAAGRGSMYQGSSKVDAGVTSGGTVHPLRLAERQAENTFARHGGRKVDTESDVVCGIAVGRVASDA
jgi:hypothetical protein